MAENVSPQSSRPSYISNHKRAFILAAAAIVVLTCIAFAFFHMGKSSSVEAYETSAATPMAARPNVRTPTVSDLTVCRT